MNSTGQEINLIAYCGLNCEECFGYKKTVSEAAKNLRREMRSAKLKEIWPSVPFLGDYAVFKKSLDGLAMMRCPKACRGGGGNPWCKIRKCCQKKAFSGCWTCSDFESCNKLEERHVKLIKALIKAGVK
jgi:hypothetical protein